MPQYKFTDAVLDSVLVDLRDAKGRHVSVSFADEGLIIHSSRPHQGKKAFLSYENLLDAVEFDNDKFFEPSKRRK